MVGTLINAILDQEFLERCYEREKQKLESSAISPEVEAKLQEVRDVRINKGPCGEDRAQVYEDPVRGFLDQLVLCCLAE